MIFSQATNSEWGSIVLSLAFLLGMARRVCGFYNLPKKPDSASRGSISQAIAVALCIIHLISVAGPGPDAHLHNGLAALDNCLSVAVVAGILVISILEHGRGVQSPHLVPAYLAVALAQDMHKMRGMVCETVFDCGTTKLRLCLEALWLLSYIGSWGREGYLNSQVPTSEDAAGLFSLVSLYWMSTMLREGYISTLSSARLPAIHCMLSSRTLRTRAIEACISRGESINLHFTIMLMSIS